MFFTKNNQKKLPSYVKSYFRQKDDFSFKVQGFSFMLCRKFPFAISALMYNFSSNLVLMKSTDLILKDLKVSLSIIFLIHLSLNKINHNPCLSLVVKALVAQLCPTRAIPCTCPPGSSVYGILQASILEWIAIPLCGGSS